MLWLHVILGVTISCDPIVAKAYWSSKLNWVSLRHLARCHKLFNKALAGLGSGCPDLNPWPSTIWWQKRLQNATEAYSSRASVRKLCQSISNFELWYDCSLIWAQIGHCITANFSSFSLQEKVQSSKADLKSLILKSDSAEDSVKSATKVRWSVAQKSDNFTKWVATHWVQNTAKWFSRLCFIYWLVIFACSVVVVSFIFLFGCM